MTHSSLVELECDKEPFWLSLGESRASSMVSEESVIPSLTDRENMLADLIATAVSDRVSERVTQRLEQLSMARTDKIEDALSAGTQSDTDENTEFVRL